MKVIGIDPGKSGGVAVLDLDGNVEVCLGIGKMTDQDLWRLLALQEPGVVYLEKVHSSPQMGVVSAFTFGECYGKIYMAAIAAGLRLELVRPVQWQKSLGLKTAKKKLGSAENKRRNKARAQELYPGQKVTHEVADALLIAEYGRQDLLKKS